MRLVCVQSRAACVSEASCVSACVRERARECAREASCVSACARERARESCQPPPEPINSRARVSAYVRLVCVQSRAACVSACARERARECVRAARVRAVPGRVRE